MSLSCSMSASTPRANIRRCSCSDKTTILSPGMVSPLLQYTAQETSAYGSLTADCSSGSLSEIQPEHQRPREICYHWYDIFSLRFTQFHYIHTEPWLGCCNEIATANLFQSFSSETCKNNRRAHHWKVLSLTTIVTSWGLRDKELAPSISSCRKQSFYMEMQKYRKWSLCIREEDGTFQKDNSAFNPHKKLLCH